MCLHTWDRVNECFEFYTIQSSRNMLSELKANCLQAEVLDFTTMRYISTGVAAVCLHVLEKNLSW